MQELNNAGVAVFMVSTDKPKTSKRFAAEHCGDGPVVLSDPTRDVSRDYGVLSMGLVAKRWTFYIDTEGRIAKIDKDVRARLSGLDLVEEIERLGWS